MSIITHSTGTEQLTGPERMQWTLVQSGLWVANLGGEFAGMVEKVFGEAYRASSARAITLGVFGTLDEAKACVGRG